MSTVTLDDRCSAYLKHLTEDISNRSVGSEGNREATRFFERVAASYGWQTETPAFDVLDWEDGAASLTVGGVAFEVRASPYSTGVAVEAELVEAASLDALQRLEARGRVLLLRGEIAREQLMPKNFVFYNPEEHRRIVALLEEQRPAALVTATGRNAALAGGVYPFPLIEDGDFDVPSVYTTEEEGLALAAHVGERVSLTSSPRRIPARACNVIATRGRDRTRRIVVTAHVDAKKDTPGALDNATGVAVLLLLAELLRDYDGDAVIELVALNGEDYYGATGQMHYLGSNRGRFGEMLLNVNVDGVGYREGSTAFSFFDVPGPFREKADALVAASDGIVEGVPWPQGDHSIFIQHGVPAIAVTSQWMLDNMETQTITHTPRDRRELVDTRRVVETARVLAQLLG